MGWFTNIKNMMGIKDMMGSAGDLAKAAQAYQEAAMAAQEAAFQPTDPNDPAWAPIEGVTVDKYAEITAGLLKKNVMGLENVIAYAESMGVKAGTWQVVQNGWTARMGQNMAVRTRYGNLYVEYTK